MLAQLTSQDVKGHARLRRRHHVGGDIVENARQPGEVEDQVQARWRRTEVKRANGDRVAVNYYLRRTPQGWKAWDVVIDGISYVNSYRTDFGEQIEAQGLDAVIKRLESGERPEAIGRQAGRKS